ncbi:UvrD-helicase domain-containing protein [Planococcus lenghuensis]|uniref:UvrD-like helicase ATP-binding domain-containing protein n=1 Tax=Planococcus lenghuensis TaxID=2213202 RepID=A0A1Q2L519_9BACL|nr:UvrD-helicase domain-containing protein [Planococcus lenghuensis]AQQ55529.1 hypothetical protein B0X71_20350 [Planococcus lenghuensis]
MKKQLKNKIVLACAGSGKTWGICNDALNISDSTKKTLMVSYTNKGVDSLKKEYAKQNSGVLDEHVRTYTWFQFVLRELIRPYQVFLLNKINAVNSFDFSGIYGRRNFSKINTIPYYLNSNNDVKANHASELAIYLNLMSNGAVINRLEEIYSCIYIDELQDLAGRDIDLLELLLLSSIKIYCVGDYKQSTLKTHNAKSNKKKSGGNVFNYLETLKDSHEIEVLNSNCSRRFIQDIADFSNLVYPGDPITSISEASKEYMGVFQVLKEDVKDYVNHFQPAVLRFDKRTDTLGYNALNFGVSKGLTLDRVLIFPNGPLKKFLTNPNQSLKSPEKYYVGVTRPRYSLAFVAHNLKESEYFKEYTLEIEGRKLKVNKFLING